MLQLVLSPVNLFLNDNYQVVSCFLRVCLCVYIVEVVMILKLNSSLFGAFLLYTYQVY